MTLREIGEDRLLRELLPKLAKNKDVIVNAGDDCALVASPKRGEQLLLKTDCVVAGIHFDKSARAVDVGWKAMARPLSDFAAVSGLPQFALVTFIAPAETSLEWTRAFYRGLNKAARAFDVAIVGGETSSTPGPLTISVSVAGIVERDRYITRTGGKIGDLLFVTGALGGSLRRKHLTFTPRIFESRWLTQHFDIHAMLDLSDGLGADLPRLAAASRVGFAVDENAFPRTHGCTSTQAINDGEDYELLFTVALRDAAKLQRDWKKRFPRVRLTQIGALTEKSKSENRKFPTGYVHFQQR